MMSSKKGLFRFILAAMFLALALVLPFLTMQLPEIGKALCPMHIPVLLCGFFCGPWYALVVGLIVPVMRFFLFGMPPIMPTGLAMSFELAAYGFAAALLYRYLPKKKPYIYAALVGAMIVGRVVWGIVSAVLFGMSSIPFGWEAFVTGAFIGSVPGIILQIVLIPVIVMALEKYTSKK